MTSPQPPGPRPSAAAGTGVDEQTLHLPTAAAAPVAAGARTAPSPYPARPAFRAPEPPNAGARPQPAPISRPRPTERWEGVGFRPDIQGLRAVAVTLVLLSHAGFTFFAGGYVGVDVFFVLSGFLITSLLVKEVFDTGKISIAGFYARRARRILPAASVVTIATVLGAWLWFPVTRLEAVMQDAFTVIVYVVNYRFVAEQTEYLNADQMPSPFQQFWSLAVEEQFYLVWPLLLLGLLLLVKRSPGRLVNTGIALAVGVFALSLILSVLVTEQSQPTAYYAAHTRAWELAAGAFLALVLPALKKTPRILGWILGIAGLAAIVAAAVLYDDATAFPGYTALLPVAGTMLVIVAGSGPAANPASSLLGTAPFQFVGRISYSLYLWHWPILILIPLAVGAEPGIVLNTLLIVATFAIAQLSYSLVETPFRNAKVFKRDSVYGIGVGILCSFLGLALVIGLTVNFQNAKTTEGDPVEIAENTESVEARLEAAAALTSIPDDLVPSLADASDDRPKIYENGCHVEQESAQLPDGCVFGDTEADTTVVVMGDSHAAQWFPALELIAEEQGWRLLTRTKSACTAVDVRVENSSLEREYTECSAWRAAVFEELADVKPDMVVLSSTDPAVIAEDGQTVEETWLTGWEQTVTKLSETGATVVTIADTPWAEESVPECLSLPANGNDPRNCAIDRDESVSKPGLRADAMELQEELGATVIDPMGWLCLEDVCPVIVENTLVYRDRHHMTTHYAASLAKLLEAELPDPS
ncbi:acyltransferase family protein [Glycomyces sp. TRM65418]|uniref:acyltransferase family protein n=1 Tax=Glycomyces sp. TRM65418 TaxID=2867006 RepID=UPI001CE5BE86|nr:acyltransferase family protein [Glycomyces sp. TRM65418]MCC3762504.1 acyltransferase family protein [Glycomyces sp. TRM65418]QZD56547.1 acyltransferase family protein [Glycomyces sp. TRM65418]